MDSKIQFRDASPPPSAWAGDDTLLNAGNYRHSITLPEIDSFIRISFDQRSA
jgi:hypothetical protein